MAVGCSHGDLIDATAADQVIKFRDAWKPETCVHLGDFLDTAAFRSGSAGTSDEAREVAPDMNAGLRFLERLRPTLVFIGNHEDRLWKMRHSHKAIIAECAGQLVTSIQTKCRNLRAELVEHYSISDKRSVRKIGGYSFLHGFMYSENATRDHAETFGNCVHAHTHRASMATARRSDSVRGYCVGTLSDIPNMDYAKARRQTLAWSHGFVWFEHTQDSAQIWLHENQPGQAWRLPI